MRKWLWPLGYTLTTLVIIFLLLPFVMGFVAKNKYKQIANIINSSTYPFKVKIINYHRGWFSADSTAQINFDKPTILEQKLRQFTITTHIIHGPIITGLARAHLATALINADFNLTAEQKTLLKYTASTGPIATAKIEVKLSATTNINFESQPLSYQDAEKNLQWRGCKIDAEFSQMFNQVQSKIDFPGFDIKSSKNNLHLAGATNNYKGKKIIDGLWFGEHNIQIKEFSTKTSSNHNIALTGLNIQALMTDKNTVDTAVNISLDSLNIDNNAFSKNTLDFEINKLNKPLFIKLCQQTNYHKNPSPDDMAVLFSNGGELNIKQLNTASQWGKLLTTVKVTFANQPNNNSYLAIITNCTVNTAVKIERGLILHLIEKFYEKTQIQKQPTTPLSKQAEALLNKWQQSGKITTSDKDSYLHVIFDYKDGKSVLNGKSLTTADKI